MKKSWFYCVSCCLVALTLMFGVVHARLTGRWGPRPDAIAAGQRLNLVPKIIGDWQVTRENALDPDVVRLLQCQGSLSRIYENVKTGDVISVAVILGPPGPISVHTPEICYSSQNYKVSQDRIRWTAQELTDEFWEVQLESNDVSAPGLRAIYGWTNSKNWQAAENPRFTFGRSPYLYKLQIASALSSKDRPHDECREFLAVFVPALRDHLLDSQ